MSIGYDSAKVPEITGVNDLLKPEFKGKVALNGDPTTASAAANGVLMTAIANGGSVDDIAPGVDFFGRLNDAGNFLPVDPTPATIESGQTPVVIDWDYLNSAETKKLPTWKVFVPSDALVGGYYFQAINKDGPHPAAARLWQEFLYSDEGQNLFLKGLARPVRADAMEKAGTVDKNLLAALPVGPGHPGGPDRRADREDRGVSRGKLGQGRSADDGGCRRHARAGCGRSQASGAGPKFAFGPSLALLPFLAYLTVFLIVPTVTVLVGAFQADEGGFTLEKLQALNSEAARSALWNSIVLSASTAVIGAVLGALLAYLVVTARPTSILRRVVLAVCGVLAQFGV